MASMKDRVAVLTIFEEKEEVWNKEGLMTRQRNEYALCLVGGFLTLSSINFQAMRTNLSDLLYPVGGISIRKLGQSIFYLDSTMKRILLRSWKVHCGISTCIFLFYINCPKGRIPSRCH